MVTDSNEALAELDDAELGDTELGDVDTSIDYIGSDDISDGSGHALTQIAIGALVGATIGGVATALSNRSIVNRINQTVRGVGSTVKRAANSVDDAVRGVGDAVQSVATGVNDTAKEVSDVVRETAEGIGGTVKDTINTVQNTAENVNDTVKSTADAVRCTTEEVTTSNQREANGSENDTLYKLIPVNSSESGS